MKTENEVIDFLFKNLKSSPKTALILGSGWNSVVEELKVLKKFSFEKVFDLSAGVEGHKGQLFLVKIPQSEETALIMAGRFHTYEGYSSYEVTLPIRAFARIGVKNIVLTSASGALNPDYKVGDIVILTDTINLFLQGPLTGAQFQDMSQPFDAHLKILAQKICRKHKIPTRQGVYAFVRGPHFESFADKKALRALGADIVGMSTAPETIMSARLGLKTLGLSCVTNLAFIKHSHQDVINSAEKMSDRMSLLLSEILVNI